MDLKGNIRVYCRVRPLLAFEAEREGLPATAVGGGGAVQLLDDSSLRVVLAEAAQAEPADPDPRFVNQPRPEVRAPLRRASAWLPVAASS
jgi:hypothetical protein